MFGDEESPNTIRIRVLQERANEAKLRAENCRRRRRLDKLSDAVQQQAECSFNVTHELLEGKKHDRFSPSRRDGQGGECCSSSGATAATDGTTTSSRRPSLRGLRLRRIADITNMRDQEVDSAGQQPCADKEDASSFPVPLSLAALLQPAVEPCEVKGDQGAIPTKTTASDRTVAPSSVAPPNIENSSASDAVTAARPQKPKSAPSLRNPSSLKPSRQPRGILKHFPLSRRRHNRHVHFDLDNLQTTHEGLSVVLREPDHNSIGVAVSDALRSSTEACHDDSAVKQEGAHNTWGGDSEWFKQEWAKHSKPARSSGSPVAPDQQPRAVTATRSSGTFHTGVSMEEHALLHALDDVNRRIAENHERCPGFIVVAPQQPPPRPRHAAEPTKKAPGAGVVVAPPVETDAPLLIPIYKSAHSEISLRGRVGRRINVVTR